VGRPEESRAWGLLDILFGASTRSIFQEERLKTEERPSRGIVERKRRGRRKRRGHWNIGEKGEISRRQRG
jgi:hypothetical protein